MWWSRIPLLSRPSERPLAVTGYAETQKHTRYDSAVEARGGELLAFGVDSFGAFGKEAMKVVEKLRSNAAGSGFVAPDHFLSLLRCFGSGSVSPERECPNPHEGGTGQQVSGSQMGWSPNFH